MPYNDRIFQNNKQKEAFGLGSDAFREKEYNFNKDFGYIDPALMQEPESTKLDKYFNRNQSLQNSAVHKDGINQEGSKEQVNDEWMVIPSYKNAYATDYYDNKINKYMHFSNKYNVTSELKKSSKRNEKSRAEHSKKAVSHLLHAQSKTQEIIQNKAILETLPPGSKRFKSLKNDIYKAEETVLKDRYEAKKDSIKLKTVTETDEEKSLANAELTYLQCLCRLHFERIKANPGQENAYKPAYELAVQKYNNKLKEYQSKYLIEMFGIKRESINGRNKKSEPKALESALEQAINQDISAIETAPLSGLCAAAASILRGKNVSTINPDTRKELQYLLDPANRCLGKTLISARLKTHLSGFVRGKSPVWADGRSVLNAENQNFQWEENEKENENEYNSAQNKDKRLEWDKIYTSACMELLKGGTIGEEDQNTRIKRAGAISLIEKKAQINNYNTRKKWLYTKIFGVSDEKGRIAINDDGNAKSVRAWNHMYRGSINSIPIQGWKIHLECSSMKELFETSHALVPAFDKLGVQYKTVHPQYMLMRDYLSLKNDSNSMGKEITIYPNTDFDYAKLKELIGDKADKIFNTNKDENKVNEANALNPGDGASLEAKDETKVEEKVEEKKVSSEKPAGAYNSFSNIVPASSVKNTQKNSNQPNTTSAKTDLRLMVKNNNTNTYTNEGTRASTRYAAFRGCYFFDYKNKTAYKDERKAGSYCPDFHSTENLPRSLEEISDFYMSLRNETDDNILFNSYAMGKHFSKEDELPYNVFPLNDAMMEDIEAHLEKAYKGATKDVVDVFLVKIPGSINKGALLYTNPDVLKNSACLKIERGNLIKTKTPKVSKKKREVIYLQTTGATDFS